MSIKVECMGCEKELDELGALLFSPPETEGNQVSKDHLCYECYLLVFHFIMDI